MKTREEIVNEMGKEYDWFVHDKMEEPSVAYVKIKWFDEAMPSRNTETIAFDEGGYPDDGEILYYCSNINILIDIVKNPEKHCDFEIVDFIGYD